MIGGPPGVTGFGSTLISTKSENRPAKVTGSCRQQARSSATASSSRAPRPPNSAPSAPNSASSQPAPTPSRSRPPLSQSTSAACFATSTGPRCGSTSTLVINDTRAVHAATAASSVNASWCGIAPW